MKAHVINEKCCKNPDICAPLKRCKNNAIYYDFFSGVIQVEETKCIGCGICVKRCAGKAIEMA